MEENRGGGFLLLLLAGFIAFASVGGAPNVPSPTPDSGKLQSVMFMYQSDDLTEYAPGWKDALFATTPDSVRTYCATHAPADGVLMLDVDNTDLSRVPAKWQKMLDHEKGKPLPRFAASTGTRAVAGKLRNKSADTLAELKKLGGP